MTRLETWELNKKAQVQVERIRIGTREGKITTTVACSGDLDGKCGVGRVSVLR